jgi:hypothetical protein
VGGSAGVLVLGAVAAGVVGAGVVVPPHPPRSSAQPIATTRQTARRMVVVPMAPSGETHSNRVQRQCALGPHVVQVTANQYAHPTTASEVVLFADLLLRMLDDIEVRLHV